MKKEKNMKSTIIKTAVFNLQNINNVLFPEEARIKYRNFDPCKAVQVIATVSMPAIINMKQVTLKHHICEGDKIYN